MFECFFMFCVGMKLIQCCSFNAVEIAGTIQTRVRSDLTYLKCSTRKSRKPAATNSARALEDDEIGVADLQIFFLSLCERKRQS